MNKRNAVITNGDFDRLNDLVHSRELRATYGSMVAGLKRELHDGEVVPPHEVPRGVVTMNSTVRFRDLRTREDETYTVVYPRDADVNEGRVSVLAPLGTALLGARIGDIVDCKTPGGIRRLRIEQVLYQPEAAGDFHL